MGPTMIERTERKLRETEFFWLKLHGERDKIGTNSPEAFQNYLSSFLSAGRAVTLALQWEEKEKYDSWFSNWAATQLTEEQRKLISFMVRQRNYEQKRGGAETIIETEFVPMIDVRQGPQGQTYGLENMSLGSPPVLLGITRFDSSHTIERPAHYFDFGGKTDVVSTCEKYRDILQKIVREFKEAHPESPATQEAK